eukprot:scaffold2858_cov659-Pavlova_lutheri.AAC.27
MGGTGLRCPLKGGNASVGTGSIPDPESSHHQGREGSPRRTLVGWEWKGVKGNDPLSVRSPSGSSQRGMERNVGRESRMERNREGFPL